LKEPVFIDLTITAIENEPLASVPYLTAGSAGRTIHGALPLRRALARALPAGLDAILITSDLQAIVADGLLLGEALANRYVELATAGDVPPPERVGVILAGDLYSAVTADQRGISGCVVPVWERFATTFRWVAGVLGNHDTLGNSEEQRRFAKLDRAHLLDASVVELDGLVIAGVGGIIGKEGRPRRRSPARYASAMNEVIARAPHILILHESPTGGPGQRGRDEVKQTLVDSSVPLVACGHVWWRDPLASIGGATQVVNVDGRALLLVQTLDGYGRASPNQKAT
jgi:hypothetical protein